MNTTVRVQSVQRVPIWRHAVVLLGYALAVMVIVLGWSVREQNLVRAADGLGYAMGIVGASLMVLLLVYPLRKRLRSLQWMGSVRFWFKTHMIFGILGPLLVLLHSNFSLGSFNSRIALFCTLVVSASGIVGRYLYAKIHYGMYGQRATLSSMQADFAGANGQSSNLSAVVTMINERLRTAEQKVVLASSGFLPSLATAISSPFVARGLERQLGREVDQRLQAMARESSLVDAHRSRLRGSARAYLQRRLTVFRKFSQLSVCERLFGFWHVLHFPLFIVMVVAAIVHVVAVHAY